MSGSKQLEKEDIMILCVNFLGSCFFLSKFIWGTSVLGATGAGKSFVRVPDVDEIFNLLNFNDLSS